MQSRRQRDRIRPLRLDPPLIFRDERYTETWTKPSSESSTRVLDHNTREIRAEDVPDLLQKLYGYPRDYRATSLVDEPG